MITNDIYTYNINLMLRLFLPKLLHCHSRQIFSAASSSRSIVKQLIVRQDLSSTQKVIGDVASYKDFLPFCTKSKVDGASDSFFYADLTFEWGSFQETIRHAVTIEQGPPSKVISVAESSKVAKSVTYVWELTEIKKGTQIDLELSVEFNSIVHAAIFDLQIDSVSEMMIGKFRDRIATAHL